MNDSPATRASLLVRLRDRHDGEAWRQFVAVYAPLVYGFARKRGLQDADAADLMQEVLRAVAGASPRLEYDPRRGTFRGWLYTVTRNKLYNFLSGRRRRERGSGATGEQELLEEQAAPAEESALWDREYERRLFSWAAERVRGEFQPATWQAFWQTAVEGKGAREAGAALGLSVGAVYVAKSRVLARLREEVRQLEAEESPSAGGVT
jgi:RNA polymerase sigma-70 factor (ECF subfamily)